ncbi:lyase family protein [Saccharopolyspora shandongensis]
MNANEVIANGDLEILGRPRGDYATVHPLDHVNFGQSTNDVYPTAVKLALDVHIDELLAALARLRGTQLQDAVPMTLGQEFGAFAVTLGEDETRLSEVWLLLHELNLGGLAIGTGLNVRPGYREAALAHLRDITGITTFASATNLVEATQDVGVFVQLYGVLKRTAVKVSKICNDLRLLSSGPQARCGEIMLPTRQAGSSIRPGKVDPVISEMVNQIAFDIIGNDVTVTLAVEGRPAAAQRLRTDHRAGAQRRDGPSRRRVEVLAERCVAGIDARREHLGAVVAGSTLCAR